MNSIESVKKTVSVLRKNNTKHVLMHCVNLYPVNYNLIRLNRIKTFQKLFPKSIIGYSDHSIGPTISTAAMGLGAKVIEKHFVISKDKKGPDVICSMDSKEFKMLLKNSNIIHSSLSSNKDILIQEEVTRRFAFHSVVSKENILKNKKITKKKFDHENTWDRRFSSKQNLLSFWKNCEKKYKKE